MIGELLAVALLAVAGAALILLLIPPATLLSALGGSTICVGAGWLGSRT